LNELMELLNVSYFHVIWIRLGEDP